MNRNVTSTQLKMVAQSDDNPHPAPGAYSPSSISPPISSNRTNSSAQETSNMDMLSREEEAFARGNPVSPKSEPSDLRSYHDFEKHTGLHTIDEEMADHTVLGLDLASSSPDSAMHQNLFGLRRQRRFISESDKDDLYWDRRKRNNEAAKRSREKRRYNDMVLETRVMELTKENNLLKAELDATCLREQRAAASNYGNNNFRFGHNGVNNKFGNSLNEMFDRERSPQYAPNYRYDPYPMSLRPLKHERDNVFPAMARSPLEQRMFNGPSDTGYSGSMLPDFSKASMDSSQWEISRPQQWSGLHYDQRQKAMIPHLPQHKIKIPNFAPTATTYSNDYHQPPQLLNAERDILLASRNRGNSMHFDALPRMPGTSIPVASYSSPIVPSFPTTSLRTSTSNSSIPLPSTSKAPLQTIDSSLPFPSALPPNKSLGNFNDLRLDSSAKNLPINRISQPSSFLTYNSPSMQPTSLKTTGSTYSASSENLQKRSTLEFTSEKRKNFLIDEMLERHKTYPQDLDKALNLSNQEKLTIIPDSQGHKNEGNMCIDIDEAEANSLQRVPCITNANTNDVTNQSNSLKRSSTMSLSPSPLENPMLTSLEHTINSSSHSTPSPNENLLPHKLRFKSTSQSSDSFAIDYCSRSRSVSREGSPIMDHAERSEPSPPPHKKLSLPYSTITNEICPKQTSTVLEDRDSDNLSSDPQDERNWNKRLSNTNVERTSSNDSNGSYDNTKSVKKETTEHNKIGDGALDMSI